MTQTRPYILTALLLDALETEGWKIGTGQQLRVQELLRQLPPDTGDEALVLALTPLLARNPQAQALVYEKFEECIKRADEMAALAPAQVPEEVAEAERALRRWYWRMWIPLGLIGAIVLGAALWLWWMRQHEQPVQLKLEWIVNAGKTDQLYPPSFPLSDSLPGKLTSLSLNFLKSKQSQAQLEGGARGKGEGPTNPDHGRISAVSAFGTCFIENDTCLVYTAKDSVGLDSLVLDVAYSDGKKAELQLRIFISRPSGPGKETKSGPEKALPLFSYLEIPHPHDILALRLEPPADWVIALARWWYWLRWVLLGLLAATLVAAWQYWQQKRRKLIAELRSRDKPPYVWNIHIPGSDNIAMGDDFAHLVQVLRRRAGADAWRLDLHATIAATAEHGGMPEFRFRQQTRPVDYLMLIDRQSVYNHRAQLYDALYRAFREQEIEIARFFFDSDIRLCHNEEHPNGLRLTEIAQRYGDARLIVVGTGAQIISPINGQVESWASLFQTWGESALLSPKPHGEWGRNERRLAECFSVVLPATLQSLAFWIEESEDGEDARFEEWREKVQDAPAAFWQPDPEVPLPLLQMQYGERMVRWIAACAIYPALHYDLTLWLGQSATAQTAGTNLTTLKKLSNFTAAGQHSTAAEKHPDVPINLEDLSALFRLRWFVDGQIPHTARAALLDWLQAEDPESLAQTRLALADLLRQNPPPKDSAAHNDHSLSVAVTEWLATKDAKRRKELEKQIAQLLDAGAEADFVTLKYLDKPRGPLDFEVPNSWKKYVHPGGQRALGNRLPMMLAVGIGLLVFGFFGNRWMENWLSAQMNPCKGETVEYTPRPENDTPPEPITLCLDSAEDTLLWQERQAFDFIDMGAFVKMDSLVSNAPEVSRTDSVLGREIIENLVMAYYNKGVFFYEKNMRDSACYCFEAASVNKGAYLRPALAWCGQPDTAAPPPVIRLLGPIAVTVVDAATGQALSNARLVPQGMKASAVRQQGGKLSLTPPGDWGSPTVTLLVKVEGYVDSLFRLSVDNVQAFPTLGLRKAPAASWLIGGAVRDADDNAPLAGVKIKVAGLSPTISDAAGQYEVRAPFNPNTTPTTYSFEFQKEGYQTAQRELTVERLKAPIDAGPVLMKKNVAPAVTTPPTTTQTDGSATKPDAGIQNSAFLVPQMVPVPGGIFTMGSTKKDKDAQDDEQPAHQVRVAAFELGKYEVTNDEFVAFLNEKGNQEEGGATWINLEGNVGIEKCRILFDGKAYAVEKGYERHPVLYVSWYGATAFCQWLSEKTRQNFRLPSEAEWEYAARGGNNSKGYTYAGSNNVDEVAWYTKTTNDKGAQKVGGLKANELGLYDMSGNVYEWCADNYHSDYTGAPGDGSAWTIGGEANSAVLRGGSWDYYDDFLCRSAYRIRIDRNLRYIDVGFRCARASGGK